LTKTPVSALGKEDRGKKTITVKPIALSLIALLTFALGAAAGTLVTRQRYKSAAIVVAVNGKTIDQPYFFQKLEIAAGPATIHTIVEEELRKQFAKKLGVAPTEEEIARRLNSIRSQPNAAAALEASGQTLKDVRDSVEVQLSQANVLARGIDVTDKEVRDYYKTQSDPANLSSEYYKPATAQIQAVITRSKDKITQAQHELSVGVSMEEVAQKYSEDPSSAKGGVFPPIVKGRTNLGKIKDFESTVFGLEVGKISSPVEIGGAWWIIRCNDKTPTTTIPFEQVKDDCKLGARVAKGAQLHAKDIETQFKQFQQSSNIQAFWQKYQNAVHP